MAALPAKVVKKILDLEFWRCQVTINPEPAQVAGRPPPPARLPVTNISVWMERYSLMAATLATRFPEKAPEFFAYQAAIIRAERNFEAWTRVAYQKNGIGS